MENGKSNAGSTEAHERVVMLMGAPSSGKTAYISLCLGYLQRLSCKEYAMEPTRDVDYQVTQKAVLDMEAGHWPDKTEEYNEWQVNVSHLSSRRALAPYKTVPEDEDCLTKWVKSIAGKDVWEHICFYDCSGEYFHEELGKKAKELCQKSQAFLFFVDAEKISDKSDDVRKVLKNMSQLLKERTEKETHTRFHVAIILTKCDRLVTNEEFGEPGGKSWNSQKIEKAFMKNYGSDIARLTIRKNLVTKCFCVSCIPVEEHVEMDDTHGAIPAGWEAEDMAGQLEPLRWISAQFE